MISTALVIAAFILFLLAAIGVPAGKVNLLAAGLACWAASILLGRI